jgi:small subunit ribosomal protein S20
VANHKSAAKRAKQSEVRRLRNKSFVSQIKTCLKGFSATLESKDEAKVAESFKQVQSMLQKGVTKGVVHKNTAARKISRLNAAMSK